MIKMIEVILSATVADGSESGERHWKDVSETWNQKSFDRLNDSVKDFANNYQQYGGTVERISRTLQ